MVIIAKTFINIFAHKPREPCTRCRFPQIIASKTGVDGNLYFGKDTKNYYTFFTVQKKQKKPENQMIIRFFVPRAGIEPALP